MVVPADALNVEEGDSLSVNGSCLTVRSVSGRSLSFDLSPETAGRIVMPDTGETVNLERPLEMNGRLHGHFVTGHVDCTGTVRRMQRRAGFTEVTISYPGRFSTLLVEKGSVALSGISLTVYGLRKDVFSVSLIPETLERTSAGTWKPGRKINIEFDIIGKYAVRAMDRTGPDEKLRKYLEQ